MSESQKTMAILKTIHRSQMTELENREPFYNQVDPLGSQTGGPLTAADSKPKWFPRLYVKEPMCQQWLAKYLLHIGS